ncbi:zincin [Polychaeton citri CBS 116435]|uniref:Zincin n=1 Tax=Polychaeton citri CBS 116435 TaxID=1314669 RepID=A0A9P4QCQ5_9PEZI|nr:zincin [Polychaeton citri CBS 116435]
MAANQLDPFSYKHPPLFDATASSIVDEARAIVAATVSVCNHVSAKIKPDQADFDNTVRPLAENENARSKRENYLRFYASTSPSRDLRDASNVVASMLNDAETDFFSQRDLFILVDKVMDKIKEGSLRPPDDESMHYLSKFHQRFLANGCGIADDARRSEFVTKKKRATDLARECRKNMADEKTGLWLTREELHGVPERIVSQLIEGDGEHAGHLWLPTKAPFSVPAIDSATRESTRKKIHYAVVNRMPHNVPLFREMTLLRDETARLLGWPNHFAFKTSQKMVKTPDVVCSLLSEVRAALAPVAEELAKDLLELKREEAEARGEPSCDLKLFFWDRGYFLKQSNEKVRSTDASVSEYFELDTTLQKLLDLYEHLFGVRLVLVNTVADALSDKKLTWHEDVRMFSAWLVDDEEPRFLAYAYLDLFPREGKYTHNGHYALQRRYLKPDGSWHDPCSCLVMNYIKPTDEKPTLLSLNNVRTLFHELGHMYHCMLSRTQYARLHPVDSDFVESPSMMLEHFFWDKQIIRNLSHHYSHISPAMHRAWLSTLEEDQKANTTPESPLQLGLEQVADVASNNAGNNVYSSITALFFATYDMLIHSPTSHEELVDTDLCELFNKTRVEIHRMPGGDAQGEGWAFGQGQSVFRAIQGKYDAGYYTYILGRLVGLNIFQAGFSDDLMNRQNGRRYRDKVLCKGGSQPEMKTLTDYLGHEPSTRPYFEWLGVRNSHVV